MNALILLTLAASSAAAGGSELRPMARELAMAAQAAGLKRVAVTGFESAQGREDGTGLGLTERLTVALARTRRVQAVERRLLPRLMEEHALERSGALPSGARLGRLLPVDGVVTGTWIRAPRGVRVLARLVQLETGLIVAAAEAELEADPSESWSVGDPFMVAVPALGGFFPGDERPADALRDALASPVDAPRPSCDGASERVDSLEEGILDLKARYWALRLREGLSGRELKSNPGSTITDPLLKGRFFARLKTWHDSERIPPLSPEEAVRFARADDAAFALHRDCAL